MKGIIKILLDMIMYIAMFCSLILPVCITLVAMLQYWYFSIPSIIVFIISFSYNMKQHKEKQGATK